MAGVNNSPQNLGRAALHPSSAQTMGRGPGTGSVVMPLACWTRWVLDHVAGCTHGWSAPLVGLEEALTGAGCSRCVPGCHRGGRKVGPIVSPGSITTWRETKPCTPKTLPPFGCSGLQGQVLGTSTGTSHWGNPRCHWPTSYPPLSPGTSLAPRPPTSSPASVMVDLLRLMDLTPFLDRG